MKKTYKLFSVLLAVLLCFSAVGCDAPVQKQQSNAVTPEKTEPSAKERAEKILSAMSLSDMVYQMLFITPEALTGIGLAVAAGETTKNALAQYPVGGLIYFAGNFQDRVQTKQMLENTQAYAKIPLFLAVDEEGGRVSRLGDNPAMGTTKQPPMQKIGETGDATKAHAVGKVLAADLKALGLNVNFAPDADVLLHEENTEIGDRAFGTDAEVVSAMVANVVKGLEDNGVSSTLKHFPGHGSTYVNSHNGTSESKRTLEELRKNELLPFQAGIAAGADFIMVSHMTLVNAGIEKVPCSVSEAVITDLLKDELGYKGIVITDSFQMGAITQLYTAGQAAVKAVQAGVDMLLMPEDFKAAHAAILQAVERGEIAQARIEESVKKILALKIEKGLL
ncbi:MAG: hypothetical protein IJD83_04725 [Clostridia bacterium]|nr:hypothetical protein [Clostridia bacterium]